MVNYSRKGKTIRILRLTPTSPSDCDAMFLKHLLLTFVWNQSFGKLFLNNLWCQKMENVYFGIWYPDDGFCIKITSTEEIKGFCFSLFHKHLRIQRECNFIWLSLSSLEYLWNSFNYIFDHCRVQVLFLRKPKQYWL